MAPLVSIIILTHNQSDVTRFCFPSLLHTAHISIEFIIVDNHSTDDTHQYLRAFQASAQQIGHDCRIIYNDSNIGIASGRNIGIQYARGWYICFLDNDVIVRQRSWVSRLVAVAERHDSPGIIGPKLLYPEAPCLIQSAGGGVDTHGRIFFHGRGLPNDTPEFQEQRPVQFVIGATFFVPRPIIEAIGLFDTAFDPVQYEDIDYCYRARARGYQVIYAPGAELYHLENRTTSGAANLNNLYYLTKHAALFRARWKDMFTAEGQRSPARAAAWKKDLVPLQSLPALDLFD